jgi:predicted Holliday junction resolvase-like endonuclease
MDAYILPGLMVVAIIYAIFKSYESVKLRKETSELNSMFNQLLIDHEHELIDHRDAERELALLKAKFEGLKLSTLTPENSVPKSMHVEKVVELSQVCQSMQGQLDEMTKKFEDSRGKQISERVRLGQVGENFAAFHDQFPYDRKQVKALFQPVDLIYFGEDEVVFIDVKTGAANLSQKQKNIRDNIKNGNVRFEVHRIDENGYTIKKAE